jgi:anaphase-promoting complex subunit 1
MVLQDIFVSSNTSGAATQHTGNPFSPPPAPPLPPAQKAVFARLTPRTQITTTLYTTMATPGAVDVDVVEKMVQLKVDLAFLQRLPEGVGVPLREAIAKCQEQPPTTWGVELLELIGRKDLRMLIDPAKNRKETTVRWQHAPNHEAMHDIHVICQTAYNIEDIGSYDPMAERDRQAVAQLLFKDDRRLHEAARLLQSSKNVATKCIPQPHWNEQEKLDRYKAVANHTAMRTLAVPSGRGLFHFSARIPLLTEKFPISGFNLACIIKPVNTTVSAEKSHFTEEKVGWAFFHSGVAAGVSISRDAKEIDTSWIVFNRPTDLTNRHGGFLLGLGLNGHLKNIAKWHAFNYLTPKHTMTSIGLLLGISASFFGTMDTTITKLLSVHVTRLLPPGSAELNISPLTQTAGIMGIGLLYANTQHRRMSEVMLSEIEHVEEQESCVPTDNLRNEGYRLAAGFALGFINLGAGNNLRGLHDMQLVERLLAQVVGSKNVSLVHIMDKATAGATIALALIYMKTNEEALARKLDVPDTAHLLDYVRPDMLLLRTVARNIVLWDQIEGTTQWIRNNLRSFHQDRHNLADIKRLDSEDLPFYNILAGLCFSVALKYAGSGDESVRDVLVYHLDEFIRLCSLHGIPTPLNYSLTLLTNQ